MPLGRREFLTVGGLAAVVALAGCSTRQGGTPTRQDTTTGTDTGGVVTPGTDTSIDGIAELRGTGTRRAPADTTQAGARLTPFALDLFRAAAPDTGNAVISPYSVLAALGMTQYGARGAAATAMAKALGGDADTVAGALGAVDAAVAAAVAAGTINSSGAEVQTAVDAANSLFAQTGMSIEQRFLDQLSQGYAAALRTCDFAADPEKCRAAINSWVADRTHDLIEQLLPAQAIDSRTRLVLVNALYLSAPWDTEFHRRSPADFDAPSGTVSVPYVGLTDDFAYSTGGGWQAVRVPYAGRGLAMTVLLPDRGRFDEVTAAMDATTMAGTVGVSAKVALTLPPFSATTATALVDALTAMGLGPLFGGDLTGVTGKVGDVTVRDVLHQAKIDVDEHGTKAAAATAVIAPAGAAPGGDEPDPIPFVADRPFLYWIADTVTGFPLFLGRVTDPST